MPIVRMTAEQVRKSPAARLTAEQQLRLDTMSDAEITAAALSDPDNPPITDTEAATARPLGRPPLPSGEHRVQVTMRWAPEIVSALRETGPGWNNFAEEAVRRALRAEAEEELPARRRKATKISRAKPSRARPRTAAPKKAAKLSPAQRRKAAKKARPRGEAGKKRKRA